MIKRTCTLKLCLLLFAFALALASPKVNAQDISIRTNLAVDALAEPNLGLEWKTGEHWSVGLDGGLKPWPRWLAWDWDASNETHWRNFYVSPEVRYYAREVFQGFFVGGDAIYTHYNAGRVSVPFSIYPEVENNRLQGSFWGGGFFVGYAWWPWQHWRLELAAGALAALAAYDRYDCPHCGTKLADERKAAVVPQLALNVAWNPVSRNRHDELKAARMVSGTDTITVLSPPVAFVVHLEEVNSPLTRADSLSAENPWIQSMDKYRPLTYLDLSLSSRDSLLFVNFELDSYSLRRDYLNNAQVLDRMQEAAETILSTETTDEVMISVVGLASIEGPKQRNDTLAIRRARAVADYLVARTGLDRRQFELVGKGEAWDWFRDQLMAIRSGGNGFTPAEVKSILDIIDREADPDVRERLLKASPDLYTKVKDNLLSDQRNSGYIRLYYSNLPNPVTSKWNGPVSNLLKSKRYREAVQMIEGSSDLLQRVKADAEAANAYGIALYFTALEDKDVVRENEALQWVEEAARKGSEAARQNLKGIEVYGPAWKEYEAWKEIMNEK